MLLRVQAAAPPGGAGPAEGNAQAGLDADLPAARASADGGQQQQQQQPAAGAAVQAPLPTPDNTYMNREARHMEREHTGELQAVYITNNGSIENGRLLIGLKNVFSKCLPNMPKEYICRLIFERRHKWVVM